MFKQMEPQRDPCLYQSPDSFSKKNADRVIEQLYDLCL